MTKSVVIIFYSTNRSMLQLIRNFQDFECSREIENTYIVEPISVFYLFPENVFYHNKKF